MKAGTLARIHPAWEIDLVCAVPLHRARERERGFDQAEIQARSMDVALPAPAKEIADAGLKAGVDSTLDAGPLGRRC